MLLTLPRIVLAGVSSGVGKTTITLFFNGNDTGTCQHCHRPPSKAVIALQRRILYNYIQEETN